MAIRIYEKRELKSITTLLAKTFNRIPRKKKKVFKNNPLTWKYECVKNIKPKE